jgi:glutamine amidotransferase
MVQEKNWIFMIDMNMGNLGSVQEAFHRVGAHVEITTNPQDVRSASVLVIPGVGAFGDGIESLSDNGLIDPILIHARAGKPIIGICVGMQLLAEAGEEYGLHKGLGLIRGTVKKLCPKDPFTRIPNMGWSDVNVLRREILFTNIPDDKAFYFAHSYYLDCTDSADVAGQIEYGGQVIPVAVERGKLFGMQFHPEKSQDVGLDVLSSLISYLKRKGMA